MNRQRKEDAEQAAEIFLNTMPTETYKRFEKKNLHHQLAYFFCWCEEMQEEFE